MIYLIMDVKRNFLKPRNIPKLSVFYTQLFEAILANELLFILSQIFFILAKNAGCTVSAHNNLIILGKKLKTGVRLQLHTATYTNRNNYTTQVVNSYKIACSFHKFQLPFVMYFAVCFVNTSQCILLRHYSTKLCHICQ